MDCLRLESAGTESAQRTLDKNKFRPRVSMCGQKNVTNSYEDKRSVINGSKK